MNLSQAISNMLRSAYYRKLPGMTEPPNDVLYQHLRVRMRSTMGVIQDMGDAIDTAPYTDLIPQLKHGPYAVRVNDAPMRTVPIDSETYVLTVMFATAYGIYDPDYFVPIVLLCPVRNSDWEARWFETRKSSEQNSLFGVYLPSDRGESPARVMSASSASFWSKHERTILAWCAFMYDIHIVAASAYDTPPYFPDDIDARRVYTTSMFCPDNVWGRKPT